jgi:hypothetical protein
MPKYVGKIFSNVQLGMRVYTKLVMIMELVINFATFKNLAVKSIMFPHYNIHKFIALLMENPTIRLTIF